MVITPIITKQNCNRSVQDTLLLSIKCLSIIYLLGIFQMDKNHTFDKYNKIWYNIKKGVVCGTA